jgi:hypothetical protein
LRSLIRNKKSLEFGCEDCDYDDYDCPRDKREDPKIFRKESDEDGICRKRPVALREEKLVEEGEEGIPIYKHKKHKARDQKDYLLR